jgi:sigma-E factor negative regulatory protein RseA
MVERERISALMDGELDNADLGAQVKRTADGGELARCWDTYHLIGESLRREPGVQLDLAAGISRALASEPTVLAPGRAPVAQPAQRMRTLALSMAATVAGIGVVIWMVLGQQGDSSVGRVELVQSGTVSARSEVVTQAVDADVNDYMMAHQEYSPTAAMHGVASYVRTVSAR